MNPFPVRTYTISFRPENGRQQCSCAIYDPRVGYEQKLWKIVATTQPKTEETGWGGGKVLHLGRKHN